VPGGVVRAHKTAPGKVAVVIGGGSGHYPAFCGTVGPGFADGAVVGNIFTLPSPEEAASVARAAHGDAGVLLTTGNYAGDVMNFGLAVTQLRSEGIDVHYLAVTDHVASAPQGKETKRRGIAGDFASASMASPASPTRRCPPPPVWPRPWYSSAPAPQGGSAAAFASSAGGEKDHAGQPRARIGRDRRATLTVRALKSLERHPFSAHRLVGDHLAHRVDRGPVAAVLVAAPGPAAGQRGRLGDPHQVQPQVAVREL
jgi:Dak1 domain-containing protein